MKLPQNGLLSMSGGWCHLYLIFRFLIGKEEAALFSEKELYFRSWQFCKTSPHTKSSITKPKQQPGNQKPNLFLLSIFFQNLKTLSGKFQCEQPRTSWKCWHLPGRKKSAIIWPALSATERRSEEPKWFIHLPLSFLKLARDGGKGLRLGSFPCMLLRACFTSRYCPGSAPT